MDDVTIPITPNYNLSCPDKTQHIRQNPPLSDVAHCWQNQHFRDRWASLLSVDDILDAVVARLEAQGVLDKTFIFYSSDHGYKQGQWRVGTSKQHPYETDIRVPFLVRGPGVQANSTHDDIVGNVDLTPPTMEYVNDGVLTFAATWEAYRKLFSKTPGFCESLSCRFHAVFASFCDIAW